MNILINLTLIPGFIVTNQSDDKMHVSDKLGGQLEFRNSNPND